MTSPDHRQARCHPNENPRQNQACIGANVAGARGLHGKSRKRDGCDTLDLLVIASDVHEDWLVSTVPEIREAIQQLPPKEAWKLAEELRDYLDVLWDQEFEQDVQEGRLDAVIERARAEHASGQTRSMDEIIGDD